MILCLQQTNILTDSYVFKDLSMAAVTEIMQVYEVPQTIAIENHSDIAHMRCWIKAWLLAHELPVSKKRSRWSITPPSCRCSSWKAFDNRCIYV